MDNMDEVTVIVGILGSSQPLMNLPSTNFNNFLFERRVYERFNRDIS